MTPPPHPLVGRQGEVLRIRRGSDPNRLVRLADGTHAAIARSWTDDATVPQREVPASAVPLLALEGLRPIVHRLNGLRATQRGPRAGSSS